MVTRLETLLSSPYCHLLKKFITSAPHRNSFMASTFCRVLGELMKSVFLSSNRHVPSICLLVAGLLLAFLIQIPHANAQSSPPEVSAVAAAAAMSSAVSYFNYNGGGSCNQWGCSDCGTCSQWGCPGCGSGHGGGSCNQWGCSDGGTCNQWGCSNHGTCSQWGCP